MDIDGADEEVDLDDVHLYHTDPKGFSGFCKKRKRNVRKRKKQNENNSTDHDSDSNGGSGQNLEESDHSDGEDENQPIEEENSEREEVLEDPELASSESEDCSDEDAEADYEEWAFQSDDEFNFEDERQNTGFNEHKAKLHLPNFHQKSIFKYFEHFMPVYFVEHIVLPCTNVYAREMDSQ